MCEAQVPALDHARSIRFDLGAPSTVAKALGVLVARELLTREAGRNAFDVPFFRRWVERHTLADLGLTAE